MEDSLDSLLEDAGLEGTGSEDGTADILHFFIVAVAYPLFNVV